MDVFNKKRLKFLESELELANNKNIELEKKLEESLATISKMSNDDTNSVTIKMNEDLTEGTPIIRWDKEKTHDALRQGNYINSSMEDQFTTQLGLMLVAREILEQIISSYEESLND